MKSHTVQTSGWLFDKWREVTESDIQARQMYELCKNASTQEPRHIHGIHVQGQESVL